jgi:nucleotide-binding universal stress UspA family protein
MSEIIVGVEDSARSRDALAFACRLAEGTGARIVLANAYPHARIPSRELSAEFDGRLHADAEVTLYRMRLEAEDAEVVTRALPDASPARALQELAEDEGAALIVIGSSERGAFGRVLAGTTAERLLHGSPCPVAVVPQDFRLTAGPIRRVLVAYDGSDEAKAALRTAATLARSLSATVDLLQVIEPTYLKVVSLAAGAAGHTPPGELLRDARGELHAELAELEPGGDVQAELVLGDAVRELARRSEDADLLVMGSRGYGPHRAVLLGSVSGRLVRMAACPVLVLPRGSEARVEELHGAAA